MSFVDEILNTVEEFVNALFDILNSFFEAFGIDVNLEPLDM